MKSIYALGDCNDLSKVTQEPIARTKRIKYSCFDVSSNYIVLGATSGSLYIFTRIATKFIQLVPSQHGVIQHLVISPDEKYIAYVTSRVVCMYAVNLFSTLSPQIVSTPLTNSIGKEGVVVTNLYWGDNAKYFYYGDQMGNVCIVTISFFVGRHLLGISSHPILFLESPIIQIAAHDKLLLVSNSSKCILCNTETEEFKQIGNRQRDGNYGACFLASSFNSHSNEIISNTALTQILCARPGARLWQCNLDGSVLQTHQYKAAFEHQLPTELEKLPRYNSPTLDKCNQNDVTVQFSILHPFNDHSVVSFNKQGFFLIDVEASAVMCWNNQLQDIRDVRVLDKTIYVHTNSFKLYSIRVQCVESLCVEWFQRREYQQCVDVICLHEAYFQHICATVPEVKQCVSAIRLKLMSDHDDDVVKKMTEIIGDAKYLAAATVTSVASTRLDSGIYAMENSFCDNLKYRHNGDGEANLRETFVSALAGKLGKNIIKYKLNIFNSFDDEEGNNKGSNGVMQSITIKKVSQYNREFSNGETSDTIEDSDIVAQRTGSKIKSTTPPGMYTLKEQIVTDEDKIVRNLFMIYRSAQISNYNLLDRYENVFDRYDSYDIVCLLDKLKHVMIENGEMSADAERHCCEMYLDYLKPELIWEIDNNSREFILNAFIAVNAVDEFMEKCAACDFPIMASHSCRYETIGNVLLQYLWSRHHYDRCIELSRNASHVLHTVFRFYLREKRIPDAIKLIFVLNHRDAFRRLAECLDPQHWELVFYRMSLYQNNRINCFNCDEFAIINIREQIYTWQFITDIAFSFLGSRKTMALMMKFADKIPSDAISKDLYYKCLLKA